MTEHNRMQKQRLFPTLIGPLVFIGLLLFQPIPSLQESANAVLGVTLWMGIWWMFEVVHISVTALLPIILFPLTNGLSIGETTAAYGHKYIFLYMGGFMLAIAIEKWNLHKRIALNIIGVVGTDIRKIILGFMMATAFLSMWISNTATSVMMLPIGIAVVKQLAENPLINTQNTNTLGKMLMLGIAYGCSIGGVATLIGTPPNLVLAGVIQETYGIEITFAQWLKFGFPISVILLVTAWFYLTRIAFKLEVEEFPGGSDEIKRLKLDLGEISREEKWVATIFACTAFCWMTRVYLLQPILPGIDDTIIAVFFGVLLFIIPAKEQGQKILNWEEAVRMPWGIILLFGGGMALAKGFEVSGLASWIGSQMIMIQNLSLFFMLLVVITFVNFLTEITSNLATTAMLLPILAPIALQLDIHPYPLLIAAAVAASCAFMLPVATPPNAVVFGSGYLKIKDMVRSGLWLNIFSILLILSMAYWILPLVWGFDPHNFPNAFKLDI